MSFEKHDLVALSSPRTGNYYRHWRCFESFCILQMIKITAISVINICHHVLHEARGSRQSVTCTGYKASQGCGASLIIRILNPLPSTVVS